MKRKTTIAPYAKSAVHKNISSVMGFCSVKNENYSVRQYQVYCSRRRVPAFNPVSSPPDETNR